MENIENKVFEKKYPSSGCIFLPLGLLMAGLALLLTIGCVVAIISFFTKSRPLTIDANSCLIIPIILILWGLAYFCFSRCRSRIPIGIYPTHITIDNKKFLWFNVQNIAFSSWEKPSELAVWKTTKHYAIRIEVNKRKQTKVDIIFLIIIIILSISVGIMGYYRNEGIKESLRYATLSFFLFTAMFGVNFIKPGSKQTEIEIKDIDTVLDCTKYYADLYHIPLQNKIENKTMLDL